MALPKVKKKAPRAAPRVKRGAKLIAPSWDGWEDWDGQKFHRFKQSTHAWYYENYKPADLWPSVFDWMKTQEYTPAQIKLAKAAPPHSISVTAAINCKMLLAGMPDFNGKENEYWQTLPGTTGQVQPASKFIRQRIEMALKEGATVVEDRKEVAEKKAKEVPPLSIQERILVQAYAMCEGIDEWLEGYIIDADTFDPKAFDFKKHFTEKNVTGAHARKMIPMYDRLLDDYKELERMPTKGQLAKMGEVEADLWEQLKEGYSHLKKSDIKKYTEAINSIVKELEFVVDKAKANRKPPKRKPKSATKLVEKLKYLKVDNKFQITSIPPENIIKANELWVFNVKTRKIGKYVASNIDPLGQQRDGTGLTVKGTTIQGFDEKLSIQKTLRKPAEQLQQFKDAGKVKLRKFLDDIKTTDTKLNGRCNPDTVLLKVN